MRNGEFRTHKVGMALLAFGVLVGFFLVTSIAWADLEAFFFQYGLDAKKTIKIDCPVFISSHEVGQVAITLENPDQDSMDRFVRAYVSDGYFTLTREYKGKVFLEPGEKKRLTWEVFPEEAVYDRIILFRVYVHGHYPHPPVDGNCGILVVNFLGMTGKQMFWLSLGISVLSIFSGSFLVLRKVLPKAHPLFSIRNGLFALVFVFGAGLWFGLAGLWLVTILSLMIAVFIFIALIIKLLY